MHEFSVNKDMKKKITMIKGEGRPVAVGKVAAHLCLTIIIKELKLNIIKH
jgi:hypothetical protein